MVKEHFAQMGKPGSAENDNDEVPEQVVAEKDENEETDEKEEEHEVDVKELKTETESALKKLDKVYQAANTKPVVHVQRKAAAAKVEPKLTAEFHNDANELPDPQTVEDKQEQARDKQE